MSPTTVGLGILKDPWGTEHAILKAKVQAKAEACGCEGLRYTVDAVSDNDAENIIFHADLPLQGDTEDGGMTFYIPAIVRAPQARVPGPYRIDLSCSPIFTPRKAAE